MLQDIGKGRLHLEYEPAEVSEEDTVFVFKDKKVLLKLEGEEKGRFTKPADIRKLGYKGEIRYLFRIDDRPFFVCMTEADEDSLPDDYEFDSLMSVRFSCEREDIYSCMTAFHLFTWYSRSRFCGHCGTPLVHSDRERMLRCEKCGNMFFPVIAPAVIVGVTDGDNLLMTKYTGREYGGWALIAGFCEIGETVGDTVRREVFEEAGVHVKNIRYVSSQPWGMDSNLLVGVFCDVDGDTGIRIDEDELAVAEWVKREDVPDLSDNESLTGHMMGMFHAGKENGQAGDD